MFRGADSLHMKEMRLNVRSHPFISAIVTLIHSDVTDLNDPLRGGGKAFAFERDLQTAKRKIAV